MKVGYRLRATGYSQRLTTRRANVSQRQIVRRASRAILTVACRLSPVASGREEWS
jgi:hypothetical protein